MLFQILDHALFHAGSIGIAWVNRGETPARGVFRFERRRHVDARNAAQGAQQMLAVASVPRQIGVAHVEDRFFAVPE